MGQTATHHERSKVRWPQLSRTSPAYGDRAARPETTSLAVSVRTLPGRCPFDQFDRTTGQEARSVRERSVTMLSVPSRDRRGRTWAVAPGPGGSTPPRLGQPPGFPHGGKDAGAGSNEGGNVSSAF